MVAGRPQTSILIGRKKQNRRKQIFFIAAVFAALVITLAEARSQTLPTGFIQQTVFSGLTQPTAVRFSPDGRVFVAEKSGVVKVFANLTATTPTVFADLSANVYSVGESGLLGMTLDPNFPTMPYIYVFYTYNGAIGGLPSACAPAPDNACLRSGRLSRLTAQGDVISGPEKVLVADWYQRYPTQSVGHLAFGPDGALYASAGDGANATVVDIGQDDNPSPDPANEGGALRSQDLRTPADPVTLDGSIIAVHPDTGGPLPQVTSMIVGAPIVDGNGVKSFSVTSVYQGPQPTIVRVLEPTNPAAGKPRRFLYVLPVETGVTGLSSAFRDGLEELRLLDVPNRYNVTLIAPSFHIDPWYADHDTDLATRLESFVVNDLVPFGDSFGTPGQVPQRWLVGFSKSGTGALSLILRNPNVFSAAAAWDGPAQLSDLTVFPSSQENFTRYFIPSLVTKNAEAFRTRNRLWISGDQSVWTGDMIQLHNQLVQAGVLHTWVEGGQRAHGWLSGWLAGARAALDANATVDAPVDVNAQRIVAYGLRKPGRFAFRPGTSEIWIADSGWNTWEEINRITNAADGVIENFGWPCYEGAPTSSYTSSNLDICNQLLPPPPPPSSVTYRASVDFSDAQGFRSWSYLYGAGTQMTFSAGSWHGNEQYLELYGNGGHPGNVSDAIRRWTAPQGGTLTITGTAFDQNTGCGSGATIYVKKNATVLWQQTLANGNTTGIAFNLTQTVVTGDNIDFGINRGPDNVWNCDSTGFDPKIVLTAGGPADTTPPVLSNGQPSGTLASGTTQTTLSVTTNENATCRYATVAGTEYASMANTFTTTGGTSHSTTVTGLTNGGSYNYYVRCRDAANNANTSDFIISFSVAQPSASQTFQASVDFSSTQGFRNWFYLYGAGTQMTFSAGSWHGNEQYLELYGNGGHPGNVSDAIRRWTAPQGGTLTITGTAFDQNTGCGSGAVVYIKKNATVLWQQTLANGNTTGIAFNLTQTVVTGDNIDFGINRGPDNVWNCDSTGFDPTIVLAP